MYGIESGINDSDITDIPVAADLILFFSDGVCKTRQHSALIGLLHPSCLPPSPLPGDP